MGWGDCKAGAGNFVVLKNDGDMATFVVLGEPVVKEATDKKGVTRKRCFVNVAVSGKIEAGEKCSIFACNITTAEALSKALKAEEGKDSLVGKVHVEVKRKGVAADIGTKYLVAVVGKVTPAEAKKLSKMEMNDLDEVEFTSKN